MSESRSVGTGLRQPSEAAPGPAMLRRGLAVAAVVVVLDQLSKLWVRASLLQPLRDIEVTPFFKLIYTENRGVSFSMFHSDSPAGPWLLSALALAIVAALLWWLRRVDRLLPALAIGLVIGGAVGNVIDRLRLGGVVDFLYFHLGDYYWPAFNLADSAISVGVVALLADGLFRRS